MKKYLMLLIAIIVLATMVTSCGQSQLIAKHEGTIAELESTIAELEGNIAEQNAQIAEQNLKINEQKATIADQQATIQELLNPAPAEGSVLEFLASQVQGQLGDYARLVITTKVTNVGGNGAFYVYAEVVPELDDNGILGSVEEPSWQYTKIYLKTGEQEIIHFYFWFNGRIGYDAWCSDTLQTRPTNS